MVGRLESIVREGTQRAFREHPATVGETYTQHLRAALGFGIRLLAAGIACVVHALVPGLFRHSGSEAVRSLQIEMDRRLGRGGA